MSLWRFAPGLSRCELIKADNFANSAFRRNIDGSSRYRLDGIRLSP
jgi:hypothetical protein